MILRKAKMNDVEDIHALISESAAEGLMLARSRSLLYEGLRDITVAEEAGRIVGTGSLHILWEDLAEIRALAIIKDARGKGIGRAIVDMLIKEAKDLGIDRVFALTYQEGFFSKCGFSVVPKELLPHKVWKECIDCPKFPNCDEVAMLLQVK
ncbi:acetyltransferase, gnat family [Heliomicrobium modesticaldum Ice1]|uniref:Acetyltransferase, gnat family n=1 Tax=Heliobacterium modesticaldum (strain ATCC 51547 / Ice1) TaxID=498761 RepID=B0TD38_HELMI|nr:N-acetyltransferase [Heliomicrobium modesticaldum]ABZ82736.1 acetyltransferase, gnat family [Heliomicrobium modesticaldum Ice1]